LRNTASIVARLGKAVTRNGVEGFAAASSGGRGLASNCGLDGDAAAAAGLAFSLAFGTALASFGMGIFGAAGVAGDGVEEADGDPVVEEEEDTVDDEKVALRSSSLRRAGGFARVVIYYFTRAK